MRLLCERRNLSIENLATEVVRELTDNAGEPESKTTGRSNFILQNTSKFQPDS